MAFNNEAVWSLFLASGYLKVLDCDRLELFEEGREPLYELALTNYEVKRMFEDMVRGWFARTKPDYNDFIKALLLGDLDAMNAYINQAALDQIEDKKYAADLIAKGIPEENIDKYGFAFEGKQVLIG